MDEQSRYLRLEFIDGVTVAHFNDIQIGPDAKEPLYDLVDKQGYTKIVLNFSNIVALSTVALGILANFQKRVDSAGGKLRMCCLDRYVMQLFQMTQFDRIFAIHGTQEEAVRAF